jgi:hypothetical protein
MVLDGWDQWRSLKSSPSKINLILAGGGVENATESGDAVMVTPVVENSTTIGKLRFYCVSLWGGGG